jgi:uncharacterized protein YcfL
MKKTLIIIALLQVMFSCSSNEKKTTDDSQNQIEVGVQNNNGGIPDTTNAINLSTHKKDTVNNSKDSIR